MAGYSLQSAEFPSFVKFTDMLLPSYIFKILCLFITALNDVHNTKYPQFKIMVSWHVS